MQYAAYINAATSAACQRTWRLVLASGSPIAQTWVRTAQGCVSGRDRAAVWLGACNCPCGEAFDSVHALSCGKGGLTIARHNEIRDFTAGLLQEVCNDVEIEPKLQPLSGEQLERASGNRDPEARLDVGLWGGGLECAFFDARIFNPRAHSNDPTSTTTAVYRRHELVKRRQYEQRVRDVEMSSFTSHH